MIIQNKKAQSALNQKLIILLLVLLVVAMCLYAFFRFNGLDFFKNLPIFQTTEDQRENIGNPNSQPAELQNADPCIDYDFFWSDINGNAVPLAPNRININNYPDGVFIAIKFKDNIGNLEDSKNPVYSCLDYAIELKDNSRKAITHESFSTIQTSYKNIKINNKDYYLVAFIPENLGYFAKAYTFNIVDEIPGNPPIYIRVRAGFTIFIRDNPLVKKSEIVYKEV